MHLFCETSRPDPPSNYIYFHRKGSGCLARLSATTSSPTPHPRSSSGRLAKRQGAAKRRARLHDHARAELDKEHAAQIEEWRRRHGHVLSLLQKEQSRRLTVAAEHHSLFLELEKFTIKTK